MKKVLLPIAFTIFMSCNGFLDVISRDELSDEVVAGSQELIEQNAVGVYNSWIGGTSALATYLSETYSDNAITAGIWVSYGYNLFGVGSLPAINGDLNGIWTSSYVVIRACNVFLDNLSKSSVSGARKTVLAGEARFIRAHMYYLLFYTFGEVPLVKGVLPADPQALKLPRANPGETVAFILEDLDAAAAGLPVTQQEIGRITKGAALALKARVLLYEGRWKEAADAAKAVMDLGVYRLFANYKDQFAEANNNNSEQILSFIYNNNPSLGTQRNNDKPNLIDRFDLTRPTVALRNAYATGDKRLGYTIDVTNGDAVKFNAGTNPSNTGANNVLIRYAEVLLTYAEAKIEDNSIDQSVIDAIHRVRARAYESDNYPKLAVSDGQAALRDAVRQERRVELALEGLRWLDLKRWRLAHGSQSLMLGDGATGISGETVARAPFREEEYLRPIPQAQIDLHGADVLRQNPGY